MIARNELVPESPGSAERSVGVVQFSLYLRFSEPGEKVLQAAKLECARVLEKWSDFTNYAAYFNNSLFELPGDDVRFERIYCMSTSSRIEVLPLPVEGRLESFNGWYSPVEIEAVVEPSEGEVGQVMSVTIRVRSEVDGSLFDAPALRLQPGFRNHFWVSSDTATRWLANGREFVTKFRPLTTAVRSVTSMDFQIFDPEQGVYRILRTEAIPLKIRESQGRSHFDVRSIPGAIQAIEPKTDGVWQNETAGFMNELIDSTVRVLTRGFWIWLLLGPLVFFLLRPWVLERKRRAEDPDHHRRMAAFRRLSLDPTMGTFGSIWRKCWAGSRRL